MRIIFMGTPDFAVPSLEILHHHGYDIVAVITATDKYGGRNGKKLIESAVKKYAISQNIPVLQPKNLKNPDFVANLRKLKADLQVVVAFRMLPEIVWDMPPMGTLNLHGSLLPKYRGAAPINWAIINGDQETGVTTFKLQHVIDTGDLYYQAKVLIGEDMTAGELHDQLMPIGANLVLQTVKDIESGSIKATPQEGEPTHAPKIFHKTCEIDFDGLTAKIHNFIRGMSPYPTAWTTFQDKKLKIFLAEKEITSHQKTPGTVVTDRKSFFKIATQDGYLNLLDIQIQGRKRMKVKDFLNGAKWNK